MMLLTLRDLSYRKLRFLMVTLLVGVLLALLFVMTGMANRFEQEPYDSVDAMGASFWLVPAGTAGPFTANGTVSTALVDQIPDRVAQPVIVARGAISEDGERGTDVVLIGVVPGSLGSPSVVSGRAIEGPGELVVDEAAGVGVGDTISIDGVELAVVGLTRDRTVFAGTPLAFVDLGVAQEMVFKNATLASALLVDGRPASVPPGLEVLTSDQVAKDAYTPVKNAVSSITLMLVLLWFVAAIVIGAVVLLSALERQRDFAVLKAMGSPNRVLAGGLAIQAAIVALAASLIGAVLQKIIGPAFPLNIEVPASAFWRIPLVTVAVSLLAALAGVRRVARADPTQAFGGPGA